jgi:hypothetical protein
MANPRRRNRWLIFVGGFALVLAVLTISVIGVGFVALVLDTWRLAVERRHGNRRRASTA